MSYEVSQPGNITEWLIATVVDRWLTGFAASAGTHQICSSAAVVKLKLTE